MARRNVFLLLGPDLPVSESLHDHLAGSPEVLAPAGLRVPKVTSEDLVRSGTDILRLHKAHGVTRKEVEGAWARVCRKAWKGRSDMVVVVPGLAQATPEQVALALDTLAGMRIHAVVTGALPAWEEKIKPARLHRVNAASRDELVDAVTRIALDTRVVSLEDRIARLRKRQSSGNRAA